ncbi:16S rRNA (cytosine(1402)-N(4))-methyltransferase, partial [Candidatus Uhrbacteria bacterium]|nr:16S rRNA (cytosine(1402)-N(4))-methyltransferase [Candidatus Uhrbacteria bacterium]
EGIVVTRRPVRPSRNEIIENPRSRSARMRTFERKQLHPSSFRAAARNLTSPHRPA